MRIIDRLSAALALLLALSLSPALAWQQAAAAGKASSTTAWREVTPEKSPQVREGGALVYDSRAGVMRLFGGYDPNTGNPFLKDMWTYANGVWTFRPIDASEYAGWPSGRSHFAYAYDTDRGVLVIYGGYINIANSFQHPQGDLYEYDSHWRFINTVTGHGAYPGPRAEAAMAYDAARHVVVMFGGFDQHCDPVCNLRGETYTWDGNTWTRKITAHNPPDRARQAMAYDSVRQKVVMYGGISFDSKYRTVLLQDTWEWDGSDWREVKGTVAQPRQGHAMSYDVDRQRVLLFGGDVITAGVPLTTAATLLNNETYEFDGLTWVKPTLVSGSPISRTFAMMAYDPGQKAEVLFSGMTADSPLPADTWLYTSAPPRPNPRYLPLSLRAAR